MAKDLRIDGFGIGDVIEVIMSMEWVVGKLVSLTGEGVTVKVFGRTGHPVVDETDFIPWNDITGLYRATKGTMRELDERLRYGDLVENLDDEQVESFGIDVDAWEASLWDDDDLADPFGMERTR